MCEDMYTLIALSNSNMYNIVKLLRILARVSMKTVIYKQLNEKLDEEVEWQYP